MSDLEILGLVLLAVYLWECLFWLRRNQLAFTTWLGRRWRIRHAGSLLASQSGGFILADPLPPLGAVLASSFYPVSLSADALLAWVPGSLFGWRPWQTGRFIPWDQVRDISARGKRVEVNGRLLVRAGSSYLARKLAGDLLALKRLEVDKREGALEGVVRRQFDAETVRARWEVFKRETHCLRWLVNGLFVYLLLLTPLAIGWWGIRAGWPFLLAGWGVLTIGVAWRSGRAHRRLYPEAGEERFALLLTSLLSPPSALRVLDGLARPLLEACHPLAVAAVFCPGSQFRALGQMLWLDARFPVGPVCPTEQEDPRRVEREWRARFLKVLEEFLQSQGADLEEWRKAPVPSDPSCAAYCPRCRAQFTANAVECPDCRGIRLVRWGGSVG